MFPVERPAVLNDLARESAGIIAILTIIHIIKITVDIILQAYAIHSVYGWSLHLLGALWTSVTHFLISLANWLNASFTL